jgi:hypothetical protein
LLVKCANFFPILVSAWLYSEVYLDWVSGKLALFDA